jgi:ectoine hydroxylase-related dioxygenase (phytanoyl-CoA dioxygenase family)
MVSVKAGGAVLFRHDLWHGAAGCRSDRPRYTIQIHYGERSWKTAGPAITRPECYSPEVLSRMTPRQRVLMGEASKGIFL